MDFQIGIWKVGAIARKKQKVTSNKSASIWLLKSLLSDNLHVLLKEGGDTAPEHR